MTPTQAAYQVAPGRPAGYGTREVRGLFPDICSARRELEVWGSAGRLVGAQAAISQRWIPFRDCPST